MLAGASRGIGLALTKEMAARGWRVPAGARHGTGGQFLDRNGLTGATAW